VLALALQMHEDPLALHVLVLHLQSFFVAIVIDADWSQRA